MTFNSKLYFKYILLHFDFLFLKNKVRSDKNTLLAVTPSALYFLTLHFKLSSLFYSIQLSEFFSYELPSSEADNIFVYNFHLLHSQQRFFVFVCRHPLHEDVSSSLTSISELFLNANWLEREVAELHGLFLVGKKDVRNLMLQYGDKSAPFQKSFPAIGTKEIFYDVSNDLLLQLPVSIQF
jgi:NADH:ubiquinone oxidoreductase subunit C